MKTMIGNYEVEAMENLNRKAQTTLLDSDPFLMRVDALKKAKDKNGERIYTERQVAELMGMTIVDLRKTISKKLRERREELKKKAAEMKEAGMSPHEIAIKIGMNESTIRVLWDEILENK